MSGTAHQVRQSAAVMRDPKSPCNVDRNRPLQACLLDYSMMKDRPTHAASDVVRGLGVFADRPTVGRGALPQGLEDARVIEESSASSAELLFNGKDDRICAMGVQAGVIKSSRKTLGR